MNGETSRSRRAIAIVLLVLLTGCHTWQPSPLSPRAALSEEGASVIRVTPVDGVPVRINDPVIRNDSIVSVNSGLVELVGVPADAAGLVEIRRFHRGRTLLFAAGIVVVALGWAQAATGSSSGGNDPGPGPLPKTN